MLSFAADENFNIHIVKGVLRRLPMADIVRVQDAGVTASWCQPRVRFLELRPAYSNSSCSASA